MRNQSPLDSQSCTVPPAARPPFPGLVTQPLALVQKQSSPGRAEAWAHPDSTLCADCLPLQEAHHRICNNFAMLNSFVRMRARDLARQAHEPSKAQMLMLLDVIGVQIATLAKIHRVLATAGASSAIDISGHLSESLLPFKSGLYGSVDVTEDFEPGCFAPPERVLAISQIVTEVVTNSIKYGPAGRCVIAVRCAQSADGGLRVEVSDNGPGLPVGFDPRTSGGLGYRLLRALSESLGAQLEFESSDKGLRFALIIPSMSITAGQAPMKDAAKVLPDARNYI
jgi:two-component sensor histidine kinase